MLSVGVWWDRKHLEEFNPAMDTWEMRRRICLSHGLASLLVDGKIYVIGGATDGSIDDPVADSWERKAMMPEWRNALPQVL